MAKPRHAGSGRLQHNSKDSFDNDLAALKEQASEVGQEVRRLAETAGEVALRKMGPIEEYFQQKPMKSLLIAAGIGAIFGFLYRRR